MCWSTHYELNSNGNGDGDGDPLTITSFFVRLSSPYEYAASKLTSPITDSLTLVLYLPRGTNANRALEIDNYKIPTYSPATVSLRRLRLPDAIAEGDVIYGTKQRVHATTQVLGFQICFGEAKLLKGAFRKDDHHHHLWKLDLKSELLRRSISISEVELWVGLDGQVAMSERVGISNHQKPVPMVVDKYKRRNNKHTTNKLELQDIPEETELRIDADSDAHPETEIQLEMDLEGLRKAFDMGVWVLCLGFAVGYMVSKASITNFRPPTFS